MRVWNIRKPFKLPVSIPATIHAFNNDNSDKRIQVIKEIAILGSTGSIGTQTLQVIEEHAGRFRVGALTAGKNWRLLAEQALKFRPRLAVIADETYLPELREALAGSGIETAAGDEAVAAAGCLPEIETVVTALVGYSGLIPTVKAIKAGKVIALANKETLVVGGSIIYSLVDQRSGRILPVDSEHSAIFQCLQGENPGELRKIILTASGGPFRTFTSEQLEHVTAADALRHPNWDMGAKVTIDSASMMNKGFEMMEASWLFGVKPERIEIVVHPQSIVHSMVEYVDGSIKAQLGMPDMRMPIRYALAWPQRLPTTTSPLPLSRYSTLTFESPDPDRFPMLRLAFEAAYLGGNMPCILNAANEIAVASFLRGEIKFTEMPIVAESTMRAMPHLREVTLDDLILTNAEARRKAEEYIHTLKARL